jgi:hypothetical protein
MTFESFGSEPHQHSMGPFSMGLSLTPFSMSHRWIVESRELQTNPENSKKIKK